MSFRTFIYYCAIGGAWSGLLGWTIGSLISWAVGSLVSWDVSPEIGDLLRAADLGLFVGLAIAIALSSLDALWNVPVRQFGQWLLRIVVALFVGGLGGLLGGVIGQLLFGFTQLSAFFFFGWIVVGLLVGVSVASFEMMRGLVRTATLPAASKKLLKCVLGGTAGGILGGVIAFALRGLAGFVFRDQDSDRLLSPYALGFVVLGACIGLLVGLAQVLLREAWVRVEAGFRPGRQLILTKDRTSIGRAEGVDIPLFGDSGVEKVHAHITLNGGRFYLEEAGTTQGTFVNDRKVVGRCPLSSGDRIRLGRSVLRFSERRKRSSG
jgi:hypothetical protein